LSPLATLARGYAIARDAAGHTIRSIASVRRGDAVEVVLHDGVAGAEITSVTDAAREP